MSETARDIKEELGEFASRYGPKVIRTATVTAVNDDLTVNIRLGNDRETDARLRAVVSDGYYVVSIPAVDSTVVVGKLENSDEYVVLLVSEPQEVKAKIGTTELNMDATGFSIKRGDNSLKDIIRLIIESQQQIMVLYGNNPNFTKLATALEKLNNLLP